MADIQVEHNPSNELLQDLQVKSWPIWTKEASEFPWFYDEPETCYLLEGEVIVTPEDGQPVAIKQGDFVTFPAGMACHWKILKGVRKHYRMG